MSCISGLRRCSPSAEVFACATLVKFSVENYAYRAASLLHERCAAWARAFPDLLRFYLCSKMEDFTIGRIEPRVALASVLAPLFSLRALKTVRIEYSTYVPLNAHDADIIAMTEGWPALRRLAVCEADAVQGRGYPSGRARPAHNRAELPRAERTQVDEAGLSPRRDGSIASGVAGPRTAIFEGTLRLHRGDVSCHRGQALPSSRSRASNIFVSLIYVFARLMGAD